MKIAVFGSSTSAGSTLDQSETWPERLKYYLGTDRVHVDNYARDGMEADGIYCLIEHLYTTGVRYDLLFIMTHGMDSIKNIDANLPENEKKALRYWKAA